MKLRQRPDDQRDVWSSEIVMKLFTIEEANSLLSSVRPIVKSIQRSHRRLASFQTTAKLAAKGAESGGGGRAQRVADARALVYLLLGGGATAASCGARLDHFHARRGDLSR